MVAFWLRHRKYGQLLLVLLGGLTLLLVQRAYPEGGQWLAEPLATATAPVQVAVGRAHRAALGLWHRYLAWKALRVEVERLRAEVAALRLRQVRQDELEVENGRLRELLGLRDRLPVSALAAEVVGRDWQGFTRGLTLNRGRSSGVERLAPVIVADGVVGRVLEVRRDTAVVQLLTDPALSIGAVVQRTRAQGLVEGVAGGGLRLKLAARENDVRPGDLVTTSGTGGLFPRGIPLGRVVRLRPVTGLFRIADLEPAVDLGRVEEVLILPRGAPGDATPAFAGA